MWDGLDDESITSNVTSDTTGSKPLAKMSLPSLAAPVPRLKFKRY